MTDKTYEKALQFLAHAGILLISVIGIIAKGWVLAILWGWFVVPVFNIPQLTIPAAIGIGFMVALMVMHFNLKQADELPVINRIMKVLIEPLVVLFVGWIVHLFV